jgi:hypothetical protein
LIEGKCIDKITLKAPATKRSITLLGHLSFAAYSIPSVVSKMIFLESIKVSSCSARLPGYIPCFVILSPSFHPPRNLTNYLPHILRHRSQARWLRRQSLRSPLRCICHATACKLQCCTEKSTLRSRNFRRIVVRIAAMRRLA